MERLTRLDELRAADGYTVRALCNELRIGQSTWYAIVSGQRRASIEMQIRIANFFGVQYQQIFFPYYATNRSLGRRQKAAN